MNRSKRPPEPDRGDERKERVLHTRVPESLEAHLRERAESLGISVSNLVRNVLGHAFGLVEGVVADSHAIARAARGGRAGAGHGTGDGDGDEDAPHEGDDGARPRGRPSDAATAAPPWDDVLGWQPIVLGKNAVCARCNDLLPRGRDAALGTAERSGARLVICAACLELLRG